MQGHSSGDPRHALLLQAALATGGDALAAYQAWRRDADLGRPDSAASRLLPLVGWNLAGADLDSRDLLRLTRLRRETWARNQSLFAATTPAVQALERAAIPTLLLKGAALALTVYPSSGLRPMADVDVLVPERLAAPARRVLAEAGWRPHPRQPERRFAHLHAQNFVRELNGTPVALDLHWRALWEGRDPAGDDAWWERAEPFRVGGFESRVLAPADQLVQLCAHAARWSPSPARHAGADVVLLLRARGERLDWERVADQAASRGLVLAVVTMLADLSARFAAPVPRAALDALAELPAGWRERAEFNARRLPPALGRGLFLHWCDLARETPRSSAARRFGRFPSYLGEVWGLDHLWQVPVEAARKGWSRRPGPRGAGEPAWRRR